jgi:hypothetical protein
MPVDPRLNLRPFLACILLAGFRSFAADDTTVNTLPTQLSEPIAKVRWVTGAPAILRTNRWIPLQVGEKIPAGATIRTGAGEMIDITLDEPGHIISLGSESSAIIDLRHASVSLESGELIASLRKTRKDNTSVVIHSRFGDTVVRAGDVRVTINPAPTLAVLCGTVDFQSARGGMSAAAVIPEGSLITATSGNPVMAPLNASLAAYLTGRIDSLVSFDGPLAEKFSPSDNFALCHVPPRPPLADPEPLPGRGTFGGYTDEPIDIIAPAFNPSDLVVQAVPGSPACPVHNREHRVVPVRTRVQPIPPPVRKAKPAIPSEPTSGPVPDPKFPISQAP